MAGETYDNLDQMQQIDPEFAKEMQEFQQEQAEDSAEDMNEDQYMKNQELMEAYGAPEPEEKMNAHTFLHKAAFGDADTVRTTWLSESELGRPLFSVRFMLKMEDVAKYYLDDFCKQLKVMNKISNYFNADVKNTTDSGMSNKGFVSRLNVSRFMETSKKRMKVPIEKVKGDKEQ